MRHAVFNMRDERPIWAPPPDVTARVARRLGRGWEITELAGPVSGRGDGGGVSDDALRAIDGAEIYFGLGLPRELLRAGLRSGKLRWIHTGAAGVASLLHPELLESDVILTNSAGIHAEPIADTVLGMMLHFARGFDHAVHAQQRRSWDTSPWERTGSGIRELAGATVGIIGYGGIGRAVARRATALGMHVLALNRSGRTAPTDAVELLVGPDALPQLLERSDFIVLAVPSTPDTRGLLGGRELDRVRPGAVLINVSRGDVIAEDALLAALREGRLRGAGLDVFGAEPLPPVSPLWGAPNVLITPHVSATTDRFWQRQEDLILGNIDRYLQGEPLRNAVDVHAGY
jgi:phosphoglycerate dehydrogenase-like enzyme